MSASPALAREQERDIPGQDDVAKSEQCEVGLRGQIAREDDLDRTFKACCDLDHHVVTKNMLRAEDPPHVVDEEAGEEDGTGPEGVERDERDEVVSESKREQVNEDPVSGVALCDDGGEADEKRAKAEGGQSDIEPIC